MSLQIYQHWHSQTDADGILWLTLDRQGASVNSMNRAVFDEFDQILDAIQAQQPKGVIIVSGKSKGFIAGADITQFTALQDTSEAFNLIRQAQLVLDKLETLPIPTVAMINGFCLGGGLELALACRYRVALDEESTLIGLPEVKLGIHPGWGGTVRLPRLIGAVSAMRLMLTGEPVSARVAAKLGIVDVAVSMRELKRAAAFYVLHTPAPHTPTGAAKWSNMNGIRGMLGKLFYRQLAKKVKQEHYPAPYAIIRNWIQEGVTDTAFLTEAKSIADLLITETSRNLVRVFFLREQLKGLAKGANHLPKRVHVVGAGTMGGDIAALMALKGAVVTLQDQNAEKLSPALKRARAFYQKKLKLPHKIQAVLDRLIPDVSGDGVKQADLMIEAVFEDLPVKQKIFQQLELNAKPNAILATNTSSIPLDEINTVLTKPEQLVGIHFFNPVAKMPLVEVVCGQATSPEVVKTTLVFVNKLGKLPLLVTSSPGFCINRILMPYLLEAMQLLAEGVPAEQIDRAAIDFGMPMGPITLADKVGLDICLSVAKNLMHHDDGAVPAQLEQMVQAGQLGEKSGEGFYYYQKGKPKPKAKSPSENRPRPDLIDRLILRLLNEAVLVLHEKVVENADFLDAGMIFGTGFAPFRGGPLHYAKKRGISAILAQLNEFERLYGKRFAPNSGWEML